MESWVLPSAKAVKVDVESESWDGDYGALKARIEQGVNSWDIVHVESQFVVDIDRSKLFHKLNFAYQRLESIEPELSGAVKATLQDGYAIPVLQYGYVLAYREDQIPASKGAKLAWPALWDSEKYPGSCGLRDFPIGNIEVALLSLGKSPESSLYQSDLRPADVQSAVEEAFARLDQLLTIRNIVWWKQGDELQRGLTSGRMALAGAWSGRVYSAHTELCPDPSKDPEDCVLRLSSAEALVSTDWWVIPKNAPHAAAAEKILVSLFQKDRVPSAANFSKKQGYLVPVVDALPNNDRAASHYLTAGSQKNPEAISLDDRFWSENYTWIADRWRLWRSKQ
ncbi:MAG: extracellular solute-binding protein [Candidatus Hydrogenedentes bacterium]|nr:extracellular solute-binding protein [Candidatus Hydrogenedentota bacterium]